MEFGVSSTDIPQYFSNNLYFTNTTPNNTNENWLTCYDVLPLNFQQTSLVAGLIASILSCFGSSIILFSSLDIYLGRGINNNNINNNNNHNNNNYNNNNNHNNNKGSNNNSNSNNSSN